MKVSVIIPNLNGAGWLRDSIESIWAQTEQDFELIVIDNGSTDESLEIAHSYCGNPRYHLIENSENTGFSHAVNQGIAMAKGEYMALFNNDAFAEPNWLEELLKTAESDPKIFAVSSLMLRYYEPELADDAGDYVTILGFACKRGDGLKASRYQKPCRIFSACGGAARRSTSPWMVSMSPFRRAPPCIVRRSPSSAAAGRLPRTRCSSRSRMCLSKRTSPPRLKQLRLRLNGMTRNRLSPLRLSQWPNP